MECIFSDPLISVKTGDIITFEYPSATNQNFEYSKMTCSDITLAGTSTDIFTLIQNDETGGSFYVEKTLDYGEAMILWFLTMFGFYLIAKATFNFFWKK